ncbi:MAG TPA: flagellin [Solirubrobacteraceae bacterium]|nr:flagellin [Solirubrobacteraceae bacterium]
MPASPLSACSSRFWKAPSEPRCAEMAEMASSRRPIAGRASESRIRDADVAAEVVALTRHRVTSNVSAALAAQANVQARNAMRLLTG